MTVKDLFSGKDSIKKIYIDEWLSDLQLVSDNSQAKKPEFVNEIQWNLIELSQSLPIRILYDRGLLSLMQPGFRRKDESLVFRANLIAITTHSLISKINSMNNWFLRSKVEFKIYGDKGQFTLIHFVTPKEFYLNQFNSDFKEFSNTLFGKSRYSLKSSVSDWYGLQRDLIYENHTGLLPDPYEGFNPNFSRIFRTAPGSDLRPLNHSGDQPHPLHIH